MIGFKSLRRFLPALFGLPLDPAEPFDAPVACLILLDARFLILFPFRLMALNIAAMRQGPGNWRGQEA